MISTMFISISRNSKHTLKTTIYILHIDILFHCPKTIVPLGFGYTALGAMPLIRGVAPKGPRTVDPRSRGRRGIKSQPIMIVS